MPKPKKNRRKIREKDRHAKRQWIGFTMLLVMTISTIIAIALSNS